MRNLTFHKLPYRRNFFSIRKDSPFLCYSFLESWRMESFLKTTPPSSFISKFMNNDFSQDDLFREKNIFKQLMINQSKMTQNLAESMNIKDYDLIQTINLLVQRNILNVDLWSNIFKRVLNSDLEELQEDRQLVQIVAVLRKYIEKFVNQSLLHRFKFNLHESHLKDINLPRIFSEMYANKGPIKNLKDQTYIFGLLKEINLKVPLDLTNARKYYKEQVPQIQKLFENDVVLKEIPEIHSIFNRLEIETPEITEMFEQKLDKTYENLLASNNDLSIYEVLQISNLWSTTGRFNSKLKVNNIPSMNQKIIENNKPILYLYALLVAKQETQQLVDRIISILDIDTLNINLKITLHKCFHILSVRGYDLSLHEKLIQRIAGICSFSYPEILKIIVNQNIPIKSQCLSRTENTNIGDPTEPNIEKIIKSMNSIFNSNKMSFYKKFRFCRFSLDGILVKDQKMYAIQFTPSKEYLSKPAGEIILKFQLLKSYGIKVANIETNQPQLSSILEREDAQALAAYIIKRAK